MLDYWSLLFSPLRLRVVLWPPSMWRSRSFPYRVVAYFALEIRLYSRLQCQDVAGHQSRWVNRRRGCQKGHITQHNTQPWVFHLKLFCLMASVLPYAAIPSSHTPSIPPLTHPRAVLRYYRCRSLKDQKHSERRQARQTLHRPVGQTKCAIAMNATAQ